MKKKVFIKAYTELNLGDDLFLDILLKRYSNVSFILEADKRYKTLLNKHENLEVISFDTNVLPSNFIFKIFRKSLEKLSPYFHKKLFVRYIHKRYNSILKKCDGFISIGGSIFMETEKKKYSYDLYFYQFLIGQYPDIRKFLIGCNFGPYYSETYLSECRNIFGSFDDVCFRDRYSYDMFKDINPVRINPDIVFMQDRLNVSQNENEVGICVRRGLESELFLNSHVNLISYLVNVENKTVKLFSFCAHEGDSQFANEIVQKCIDENVDVSRVHCFIYDENFGLEAFLNSLASVKVVFAERFHAMILGLVFKQLVIPICYSKKMQNVLNDIDFPSYIYDLETFSTIDSSLIHKALNQRRFIIEDSYTNRACGHFYKLDEFLHG